MMPILAFPGEITPGQLGPIRRDLELLSTLHTLTRSLVGIPSVMQIISGSPASSASRMASAAKGGGTKMTVALAPVFSTAWATVSKTGQPSWVVPPLPGVTPPTTLVPYSAQPLAWKLPSLPVMPCTMSRVFSSTNTDIDCSRVPVRVLSLLCGVVLGGLHCLGSCILHRLANDEVEARLLENFASLLHVGSLQAQDDGNLHVGLLGRFYDPLGQSVDAQDAAEDVDEDGLHVLVGEQDLEGVLDLLLVGAPAHVEEVGRRAAGVLDDVHGRHGQTGAVDHAGDVAIELDVIEGVLRGFHFQRIFFGGVAQFLQFLVAEDGVVVEVDLAIERQQAVVGGGDEGIDLEQGGIGLEKNFVEAGHELDRVVNLRRLETQREGEFTRLVWLEAHCGVDVGLENCVRVPGSDFL